MKSAVVLTGEPSAELREVVLRRFPLRVHARAREQHDALMREFAILSLEADGDARRVPQRLTELVQHLGAAYRATAEPAEEAREEALRSGKREIDLVYRAPVELAAALDDLEALLAEADELCRSERFLLTLASDDEGAAFKRWYFDEFRRQFAGEDPTPWPGGLD